MRARKNTTRHPAETYGPDKLQALQRNTFRYFWKETNPENGLIPDNTSDNVPASIAGVGFALASYPVAVERSFDEYGLVCSFNPTFPSQDAGHSGWISKDHFALDQGPVILMIENYCSGLIWRLMRNCPYVVTGLRRAAFNGGWLASTLEGEM